MCFGTFDIFHKGHEYYLTESKKQGDYLVVIVARDSTVLRVKGHACKFTQDERVKRVSEFSLVDKARLGNEGDIFSILDEEKPHVICLGYDQMTVSLKELQKALDERGIDCEVLRIGSFEPETYKSHLLR